MTAYLKVFGTKNVDFDRNISCFTNLAKLVGDSVTKELLALSSNSSKQWVMYLMCQRAQQRFSFVVLYDNKSGDLLDAGTSVKLLKTNVEDEIKDPTTIFELFQQSSRKLCLGGLERTIEKPEFISKIEELPLVANLLRAETLYRDKDLGVSSENKKAKTDQLAEINMVPKKKLTIQLDILVPLD
jgi:hypothetical protein